MTNDTMSKQDMQQLTAFLKACQPGFLPYPIFEQIARIIALPVVEFIPLRQGDNSIEVLLIDRGPDDPFWPNALHTPGTVIRATDLAQGTDNAVAFERIAQDELLGTSIGQPQYLGSMLHASKRGVEQAQLYWVEVSGEPRIGAFYKVDELPPQVIDSQIDFINLAAADFSTRN